MGEEELNRDLGYLEAEVAGLKAQLVQVQAVIADNSAKIATIHDAIMKATGGWRMLVIVGTACAAISAFITTVLGAVRKS